MFMRIPTQSTSQTLAVYTARGANLTAPVVNGVLSLLLQFQLFTVEVLLFNEQHLNARQTILYVKQLLCVLEVEQLAKVDPIVKTKNSGS